MFTEREKKVFFATELDAELTAQAVAQKTRLKTGSVQRILSRLIERGVISGRTAVVDIARLGLSEFGIRLQIEFKSRGHRMARSDRRKLFVFNKYNRRVTA